MMGSIFGNDFGIMCNGFEFEYDGRLAGQLKRKRHDSREFEVNTCAGTMETELEALLLDHETVDEDYSIFLNYLMDHSKLRHSEREGSDDDSENDVDCESDKEDSVDPQYKIFLDKLKEHGKSYVLEVAISNIMSLSIKYEADGLSDDEHEQCTPRKSRKVPVKAKMGPAKDLRNCPNKDKMKTPTNLGHISQNDSLNCTKIMGNFMEKERTNSKVKKDSKLEPLCHVSSKTDISCQEFTPEVNVTSAKESECEKEAEMVDECYEIFLNNLKQDGDSLIFAINDDYKLKYEGDDVEIADSEVLVAYNAAELCEGNYNPFVASRLVDSSVADDEQRYHRNCETGCHSEFRERLMVELQKPYEQEEFEKLWGRINERKPKDGRHRDLRGNASLKSCPTDELNPSYLELEDFICLKKKIDSVKFDRLKVLNLLRGFFFWLKNLPHVDAFRPWLDQLCLDVILGE